MSLSIKFTTVQRVAMKLYNYFVREAARGSLYVHLNNPGKRVRRALGINKDTFRRWMKEEPECKDLTQIRKRRPKLGSFDKDVVRRAIVTMLENQELVSLRKLKAFLEQTHDIQVSKQTLWKTVRQVGFTFRKTAGGKNAICERPHLVAARSKYLRQIRNLRQEGYDIVYLDESWINSHHTVKKEWMSVDGSQRRNIPSSKGERIIIAHAGSREVGFIPNAGLVFNAKSKDNRDYHSEMNGEIFQSWLADSVLPTLDRPSCIVMDNASYHNIVAHEDKIPTSSTTKRAIQEWLVNEKVPFAPDCLKPELLSLVKSQNKPKKFQVDKMILQHGHLCLRLPPYHSHLNPIELVWAKVKGTVADENTTFKIGDVRNLTISALQRIDQTYWEKCVDKVIKEEEIYWKKDGLRFLQPTTVVNLMESSDSNS